MAYQPGCGTRFLRGKPHCSPPGQTSWQWCGHGTEKNRVPCICLVRFLPASVPRHPRILPSLQEHRASVLKNHCQMQMFHGNSDSFSRLPGCCPDTDSRKGHRQAVMNLPILSVPATAVLCGGEIFLPIDLEEDYTFCGECPGNSHLSSK